MKNAAILGLGAMGGGMAGRLLAGGFAVAAYNRGAGKAEALRGRGARVAATAREAARGAEIVVSAVADDAAARAVWLGPDGALAGVTPGAVLVESSTVTMDWIAELSASAAGKGCELLDAPVTGSKPAAAAGELTFLVGGSAEALEKVRPALAAMGRQIVHLGASGSGARMKLINNFICGVQAVALADGLAAIEASGMDVEKAVAVLTQGAPGSPLVKALSARMTGRQFDPQFRMELMAKDLRYANGQLGTMEVVSAALGAFERAIAAGLGDRDFSAVIELLRRRRGRQ